jgi:hypothetical protein
LVTEFSRPWNALLRNLEREFAGRKMSKQAEERNERFGAAAGMKIEFCADRLQILISGGIQRTRTG